MRTVSVSLLDCRRLLSAMDTYRMGLKRKLPINEPMPQGVDDVIKRLAAIEAELLAEVQDELDARLGYGADSVPVRE